MAQTLPGPLATAMDATERHPVVKVVSNPITSPIPMTGKQFSSGLQNDYGPNAILTSEGRIVVAYPGPYLCPTFTVAVSNPDRTEFSFYAIPHSHDWVNEVFPVELANGDIGLAYSLRDSITGLGSALWMKITIAGVQISSGIISYDVISDPMVIRRADGLCMVAYVKQSGSNYNLAYRTSSDFSTWGTEVAIPTPLLDATHRKHNPFLFQDVGGQISLLFDYATEVVAGGSGQERTNLYHYASGDNGATWAAASGSGANGAITAYPDFSLTAHHPMAVRQSPGQYRLAYHDAITALHMNSSSPGWYGTDDNVTAVSFDPVTRKLYAVGAHGILEGIQVINPDTWGITKSIYPSSTPTFSSLWWGEQCSSKVRGDVGIIPVLSADGLHVAIYNGNNDTITEYHFADNPTYGITKNANPRPTYAGPYESTHYLSISAAWVDAASQRLYLLWTYPYIWGSAMEVGYLNLSQAGPEYTYTKIFGDSWPDVDAPTEAQIYAMNYAAMPLHVYPAAGYIVVSGGMIYTGAAWIGTTRIYSLTDGARLKSYDKDSHAEYPYHGLRDLVYLDGSLYGTFLYEVNFGNENRRGLCRINLADDNITYFRPTFTALDEYGLWTVETNPGGTELYFSSSSLGVVLFNLTDGTWEQFSNTTYPGMFTGAEASTHVVFDPLNEMLFIGTSNLYDGLVAISRNGFMYQAQYLPMTLAAGAWTYGAKADLVTGLYDYQATMAADPGTGEIFSFWTSSPNRGAILRVKWESDLPGFDLTDFLAGGSAVSIKRSIEGSPNSLEFTVTHGHLFDPHNRASLLSNKLEKYRKISVQFGEKIGGIDTLVNAGTFVIKQTKASYGRGKYPTMQVSCEDKRALWEDSEIVATDHYEAYPEDILSGVLQIFAGMSPGEINLPTLEGRYIIWFQWLDTTPKKIVDALLNRFGYYPTIDVNDLFTARKISVSNAINRTLSDLTKIIDFSPDDSFSDFVNRVVVTGESRDFVEVLYSEEPVQMLSGTTGWFGGQEVFRVWYSDDHKKRARHPRLEVKMSVSKMAFGMGGGSESITAVDPDELWIEITINVPNLIAQAVASLLALIIIGYVCSGYVFVLGPCYFGFIVALSVFFYTVMQIGNYQYQIHARPYGEQRLGVSGKADDFEFQAQVGSVVQKKIDEPLCITADQCTWLAGHELSIAKAQRRRVTFSKIADLRDEEGDTIRLPHPYTGNTLTAFITDLTRRFQVPAEPDSSAGFFDEVEGWSL